MQYELYEGLHRSKRTKACTNESLSERYKGRQIPEFKVSLGQREFRSRPRHGRNGNFRTGSHPAKFIKSASSLNSFTVLKQKCVCCPFSKTKELGHGMLILGMLKKEPGVND